jgi:hypothetical protein
MTQFDIKQIYNNEPRPKKLRDSLVEVCLLDGVWDEMEKYLVPPGVEGSKAFDQIQSVNVLRKHDKKGYLAKYNGRMLWIELSKALPYIGFRMQHGRVVGVLEHKPKEDEVVVEDPIQLWEPDIE